MNWSFKMLDRKLSGERRQQKRFKAEEGAFAALVARESRLGQIKDISIRGLSFRYIDNDEKPGDADELKIILGNQGLYLDNVPFKKISDFEIKNEYSFSTIKMRQIGLEFGELTPGQRSRLNQFIKYHTIDEV
jgi:DNA-binding cell septation regulator SpoVG